MHIERYQVTRWVRTQMILKHQGLFCHWRISRLSLLNWRLTYLILIWTEIISSWKNRISMKPMASMMKWMTTVTLQPSWLTGELLKRKWMTGMEFLRVIVAASYLQCCMNMVSNLQSTLNCLLISLHYIITYWAALSASSWEYTEVIQPVWGQFQYIEWSIFLDLGDHICS